MENIFTGKTVEDAVKAGLEALGVKQSDVDVEVLDEGKRRLIGSKPAQVRLTVKPKQTDGERALAFLEGLFPLIGADVAAQLKSEDEKIVIELTAVSAKSIIGRRGEIIDAVQTLAGRRCQHRQKGLQARRRRLRELPRGPRRDAAPRRA